MLRQSIRAGLVARQSCYACAKYVLPHHTVRAETQATPADVNITGDVEMCRYADTAFPEPGEYVPQQIHIMPASALTPSCTPVSAPQQLAVVLEAPSGIVKSNLRPSTEGTFCIA